MLSSLLLLPPGSSMPALDQRAMMSLEHRCPVSVGRRSGQQEQVLAGSAAILRVGRSSQCHCASSLCPRTEYPCLRAGTVSLGPAFDNGGSSDIKSELPAIMSKENLSLAFVGYGSIAGA